MPPIWCFHIAIVIISAIRRDAMGARLGAILFLNWIAGRATYILSGEQYNPLPNFAIDYVCFSLVIAPMAERIVFQGFKAFFKEFGPINVTQLAIGAIYVFTSACHTWLAHEKAHGALTLPTRHFYWWACHDATWAQMWIAAAWGIGGVHVLRKLANYMGVSGWHARHDPSSVPSAARKASEGRVDGMGWQTDRRLPVGWAVWSTTASGDCDHIYALAREHGLDQASHSSLERGWVAPKLSSIFADIDERIAHSRRRAFATNRNEGLARRVYGNSDATGLERMMRGFLPIRAALLAAFAVPSKHERDKAVGHAMAAAQELEEAAAKAHQISSEVGDVMEPAVHKIATRL